MFKYKIKYKMSFNAYLRDFLLLVDRLGRRLLDLAEWSHGRENSL